MDFEAYANAWIALLQSDNLDLQGDYTADTNEAGVWVKYRETPMAFASAKQAIG